MTYSLCTVTGATEPAGLYFDKSLHDRLSMKWHREVRQGQLFDFDFSMPSISRGNGIFKECLLLGFAHAVQADMCGLSARVADIQQLTNIEQEESELAFDGMHVSLLALL